VFDIKGFVQTCLVTVSELRGKIPRTCFDFFGCSSFSHASVSVVCHTVWKQGIDIAVLFLF